MGMLQRDELIAMMVQLLKAAVQEQGTEDRLQVLPTSPLVGPDAVLTSMALVSFITDVESTLSQDYSLDVTLVSEQALSRKSSPFRTINSLADYVLELTQAGTNSEPVAK